jgi:hypothetical protein
MKRWGIGIAMLVVACSAKLDSNITVDGTPFKSSSCRSGQAYGFTGVELTGADGRKLRLATRPDGQSNVFLFPAGSATGVDLGVCGAFTVGTQNSTINGIDNVKGHAELSCSVDGHTIAGNVTYENCH